MVESGREQKTKQAQSKKWPIFKSVSFCQGTRQKSGSPLCGHRPPTFMTWAETFLLGSFTDLWCRQRLFSRGSFMATWWNHAGNRKSSRHKAGSGCFKNISFWPRHTAGIRISPSWVKTRFPWKLRRAKYTNCCLKEKGAKYKKTSITWFQILPQNLSS